MDASTNWEHITSAEVRDVEAKLTLVKARLRAVNSGDAKLRKQMDELSLVRQKLSGTAQAA